MSIGYNVKTYIISNDGNTLYVGGSGEGNYTSIQDAIENASNGDTVFVYDDSSPYVENVVVNKSIFLIGENKTTTIIDGRDSGNTIKVNADNVTIKGFTIQHSGLLYPNSGINLSSNLNMIEGNLITDNFYGITLYYSFGNIIRGNIIQNDDHCGLYLSSSSSNSTSSFISLMNHLPIYVNL